MQKAELPVNEKFRLEDLQSYKILDTGPEVNFDMITELASKICNVPIALVSLVDKERQWFKSCQGLNISETPRDISICGHAILQDDIFEIKDTSKDPRFADNPMVTANPPILFYAGIPIKSPSGYNLGTLCVVDHRPRELSGDQKRALKILVSQLVALLELRKANLNLKTTVHELEQQKEVIYNQSRLASLGKMAGGIAHEINTPLAVITLSVSKLEAELPKLNAPESLYKACEAIDNTVFRISKIINSLKAISRKTSAEPLAKVCLRELVDDAVNICSEKLKSEGVAIRINGDLDKLIECRKEEISQVLINLISNAYDAICDSTSPWIEINVDSNESKVIISVTDSGGGISPSLIRKIMDPFFTTKPVGKGTGLGLSISRSIMELHGGTLEYDATSKNTKFNMIFKPSA